MINRIYIIITVAYFVLMFQLIAFFSLKKMKEMSFSIANLKLVHKNYSEMALNLFYFISDTYTG